MEAKTLALIISLALAISGSMMAFQNADVENIAAFESFKSKYGKSYSESEEIYRF